MGILKRKLLSHSSSEVVFFAEKQWNSMEFLYTIICIYIYIIYIYELHIYILYIYIHTHARIRYTHTYTHPHTHLYIYKYTAYDSIKYSEMIIYKNVQLYL